MYLTGFTVLSIILLFYLGYFCILFLTGMCDVIQVNAQLGGASFPGARLISSYMSSPHVLSSCPLILPCLILPPLVPFRLLSSLLIFLSPPFPIISCSLVFCHLVLSSLLFLFSTWFVISLSSYTNDVPFNYQSVNSLIHSQFKFAQYIMILTHYHTLTSSFTC